MDVTEAVVAIMVVAITCGIPLMGVTVRFALRPLLQDYIRLREAQSAAPQLQQLSERVALLERELELRGGMDRRALSPGPLSSESLSTLARDQDRS